MVAVPDPSFTAAVTAHGVATASAIQAASGAEVSAEATIATQETAQEEKSFIQRLLEYAWTGNTWLHRVAYWTAMQMARARYEIQKFATRRAQFMLKLSVWTARFAKLMAMIAKFMPIIKVMLIIIMVFTKFLQYVTMLIAALVVSVLLVIHKILSIPGISYIPAAIYWFIFDFVGFLVYFIVYMVILLFITLICAIIAFLNVIIPHSMEKLILCENSPSAWFRTVNWHLGNKWNRGLFCAKPCRKGYAPDFTGGWCMRTDKMSSDFCPQATVMRIYSGFNRSDRKFAYKDFKDGQNMKYRMNMPQERERMIKDYFLKRKKFFEACEDKMGQYNDIALGICSNLDIIEKQGLNGLKKKEVDKLKKVCSQAYCDPNSSYPFCSSFGGAGSTDDDILIVLLAKFGIAMIVFIIVFVIMTQIIKEY